MLSNRYAPSIFRQRARTGCRQARVEHVALSGEIDVANSDEVVGQLVEVVDHHPAVCVDLDEVTFIDARGIAACLTAQRQARARGCDLRFTNAHGIVARVIEVLGLETVLLGGSCD